MKARHISDWNFLRFVAYETQALRDNSTGEYLIIPSDLQLGRLWFGFASSDVGHVGNKLSMSLLGNVTKMNHVTSSTLKLVRFFFVQDDNWVNNLCDFSPSPSQLGFSYSGRLHATSTTSCGTTGNRPKSADGEKESELMRVASIRILSFDLIDSGLENKSQQRTMYLSLVGIKYEFALYYYQFPFVFYDLFFGG